MKRLLILLGALPMLLVAQDQAPSGKPPDGSRIVAATSTVTKYTALEKNLFQGLQENNRAAIDTILAGDFESWTAEKIPPTPRGDWIQTFAGNLKSFRVHNMAVREFADVAVVSFLLERSGIVNGKAMTPVLFIVDVWRKNDDKLAVRYASVPESPAVLKNEPSGKQ